MPTKKQIIEAYQILKNERDNFIKFVFELNKDFSKEKFDKFYNNMPDSFFEYYDEFLSEKK